MPRCKDMPRQAANKYDKLKNIPLHPVDCAYREQQGKNEETGRISDDVVSYQYCRNDTRGQLSAGDLKGNKKRPKRKNHKAKCRGNDGIEHRLGAIAPTSRKAQPSQPSKRCNMRVAISSNGIAINGTIQSEDLR